MNRVHNFSAGPAALPQAVLEELQEECLSYRDFGANAFEVSHRSAKFLELFEETRTRAMKLLEISDQDYELLFLQGGARFLFAAVPLNLASTDDHIGVVHSGVWTQKAKEEIETHCHLKVIASGQEEGFRKLPTVDEKQIDSHLAYLHYCSNNTIYGTQFKSFVRHTDVPTIADMSSDILSQKRDYSQFDLFYASAQKNIGPAGLTLLAVKRDLLEKMRTDIPRYFQIRQHAEFSSMFNTPPTFAIYLSGKVFQWMENQGLDTIEKMNREKASQLYSFLDQSEFYSGIADKADRSLMNAVFRIREGDEKLESLFVEEAEKASLLGLKGHRALGGLRASLYNAISFEDVNALLNFMEKFEQKHS